MKIDKRTWTDEQLTEAVKTSTSFNQIFAKLNVKLSGSQYRIIRGRTEYLQLDYSHFTGKASNCGPNHSGGIKNKPTSEILIKYDYGTFKTGSDTIKKRLYKENILKEICVLCNINTWQGKPLTLRLDHINGDPDDYRLENLRILCPNCDSQTSTFTGRNIRRKKLIAQGLDPDDPNNYPKKKVYVQKYKQVKPIKFKTDKPQRFCYCGNTLAKKSKSFCSYKCMFEHNRKHFPSKETLEQHIKDGESFLSLGKKYSVSDNGVRKWFKYYGLPIKLKDRKQIRTDK